MMPALAITYPRTVPRVRSAGLVGFATALAHLRRARNVCAMTRPAAILHRSPGVLACEEAGATMHAGKRATPVAILGCRRAGDERFPARLTPHRLGKVGDTPPRSFFGMRCPKIIFRRDVTGRTKGDQIDKPIRFFVVIKEMEGASVVNMQRAGSAAMLAAVPVTPQRSSPLTFPVAPPVAGPPFRLGNKACPFVRSLPCVEACPIAKIPLCELARLFFYRAAARIAGDGDTGAGMFSVLALPASITYLITEQIFRTRIGRPALKCAPAFCTCVGHTQLTQPMGDGF